MTTSATQNILIRFVVTILVLTTMTQLVYIQLAQVFVQLAARHIETGSSDALSQQTPLHYMQNASRYDPNDPDIALLLSQYQLQEMASNEGNQFRQARLNEVLESVRVATQTGPARASSWAALLQVKTMLRQFDEEWHLALNQALATGSNDPDVQLIIIRAGARYWLRLQAPWRNTVIATAHRALSNTSVWKAEEIREVLVRYRLETIVCANADPGNQLLAKNCEVMNP